MTITQDSTAPLVVVVGATGQQGGSVVVALQASSRPYRVRGITRDPSKPAAQALAKDGVEVYAADLIVENEAAIRTAFQGADIVFIVTAYWAHMNKQREVDEGKLLVHAAFDGGAKRIIWSGLQSIAKASKGKYVHVDHFDGKAEVTEYGRAKVAGSNVAFVNVDVGFYGQNLGDPNALIYDVVRGADDTATKFKLTIPAPPSATAPFIDITEYGKFVLVAIEEPAYASGGEIIAATEYISLSDIAQDIGRASGKDVVFEEAEREVYYQRLTSAGLPDSIAVDLYEGLHSWHDVGYYGGKKLTKISAKLTTWKEFVAAYDWSTVLK